MCNIPDSIPGKIFDKWQKLCALGDEHNSWSRPLDFRRQSLQFSFQHSDLFFQLFQNQELMGTNRMGRQAFFPFLKLIS